MKLAILSRNSKLYSTRRLVEAARERHHSVRVLDPLRCYMRISTDGFDMHYKGRPISGYTAVIPRIGASITRYGTAVLHQFELMGSYTPNPSAAIARARDKLRCHQLLARAGHRPAGDGVRRQPGRHRRPAVDARPAAARHQAQRRHAGRGRDADRETLGLAQRDRDPARAVRQFPGAGIHRGGQGCGPALLRGRRQRRRGDAAAGAEGRFPLQPASRRQRQGGPAERGRTGRGGACGARCWGSAWPAST